MEFSCISFLTNVMIFLFSSFECLIWVETFPTMFFMDPSCLSFSEYLVALFDTRIFLIQRLPFLTNGQSRRFENPSSQTNFQRCYETSNPLQEVQQKCKANKGGYFERKRLICWWQTLPNKAGVVGYHQGSQKSNKNKKGCHMIIQYRDGDDCSWCSGGDAERRW